MPWDKPPATPSGMIFLRHGQSEFNLHFTGTRRDPGIIDARLTDLGHAQAREAALALRDLGLKESDLDRAADLATQNPYWNPRAVERPALRQLLQAAWAGDAPAI